MQHHYYNLQRLERQHVVLVLEQRLVLVQLRRLERRLEQRLVVPVLVRRLEQRLVVPVLVRRPVLFAVLDKRSAVVDNFVDIVVVMLILDQQLMFHQV